MALTLLDLVTSTRQVTGDIAGTQYDSETTKAAVNFAIKHYCLKTGASYLEAVVYPEGDDTYAIPEDALRVNRVIYGNTNPVELTQSTFSFESMKSRSWQNATTDTAPERWLEWTGNRIKITPSPTTTLEVVILGYVQAPTALAADDDEVDVRISPYNSEHLKYAAAAWLLMLDGDMQDFGKSDALMERFNALIGYSDPVLEGKLNTMRSKGAREV